MWVQRAYKTELGLTDQQVTACKQHAGAARWAYNWGLQVKQKRYRTTKRSPTAIDLHRELNALKKTEVPWMYQVSKCAAQEALWNLDAAFKHFFRRCALKRQGQWKGKLGYPQFKTRKKGLGSFRLTGRIVISEKAIVLPRLGRLRLKEREYLPTGADILILSATVSEQAGHWYVSVLVEEEQAVPENTGPVLVIEDLHVAGMLKNHHLAQAIGDVGFAEFKRQLLYKASWYGATVIIVDRWEPSSKRCGGCGWLDKDLTLSDRKFHCEQCGLLLDRDLNAAINLSKLAGSLSDSQNACGAESAGSSRETGVKLSAKRGPRARKKQERNAS
jgi:IS605 OrfB family transposase